MNVTQKFNEIQNQLKNNHRLERLKQNLLAIMVEGAAMQIRGGRYNDLGPFYDLHI